MDPGRSNADDIKRLIGHKRHGLFGRARIMVDVMARDAHPTGVVSGGGVSAAMDSYVVAGIDLGKR